MLPGPGGLLDALHIDLCTDHTPWGPDGLLRAPVLSQDLNSACAQLDHPLLILFLRFAGRLCFSIHFEPYSIFVILGVTLLTLYLLLQLLAEFFLFFLAIF